MMKQNNLNILWFGVFASITLAIWNVTSHVLLGELVSICTAFALSLLFVLSSLFFCRFRLPIGYLLCAGLTLIPVACTNYLGYYPGLVYIVQFLVFFVVGTLGMMFQRKENQRIFPKVVGGIFLSILVVFSAIWGGNTLIAKGRQSVRQESWAVPIKYDGTNCPNEGTVEKLDYATKAYATDGRAVVKTAYVYLPYGYDESKSYDILYLLHGTGDREDYWLIKNAKNKTMLDNMIYYGDIKPLIVVTPTWYVENDCAGELDKLTYSFKEELRSDLMPIVERTYSTYAKGVEPEDFVASRDHRAFAGLSRGAVTTWHSVLNGSLDYFAWIGCYSGARTTKKELEQGIWSEEFSSYPIRYFYNTSGSFDFLLADHLEFYRYFIEREDRLNDQNTVFSVFPMRYHSQGNWHIALYNTLQLFFK